LETKHNIAVAAFVPGVNNARSAVLKMGYENEIGVQAPAGFFDPLGELKCA
jgi:hypothetical protein